MSNLQNIINELKAMNAELQEFNDRHNEVIDDYPSDIVDRELIEVCMYCGNEKFEKISCCGENHFCHTRD
jgi:hypothetical protein